MAKAFGERLNRRGESNDSNPEDELKSDKLTKAIVRPAILISSAFGGLLRGAPERERGSPFEWPY